MDIQNEQEFLKRLDSFTIHTEKIHKSINITVVDKNYTHKVISKSLFNLILKNMKRLVKFVLFFIYRVIKKLVRVFLKIVDPRVLDIIKVQDNLREENQLLKIQVLRLKEEISKNVK
jgi:hypothetical protein